MSALRRNRTMELPLQTYQCSTIGCTASPVSFVAGTVTREYAVETMRRLGWHLEIGESICPRCWIGRTEQDLEQKLRASLKLVGGVR